MPLSQDVPNLSHEKCLRVLALLYLRNHLSSPLITPRGLFVVWRSVVRSVLDLSWKLTSVNFSNELSVLLFLDSRRRRCSSACLCSSLYFSLPFKISLLAFCPCGSPANGHLPYYWHACPDLQNLALCLEHAFFLTPSRLLHQTRPFTSVPDRTRCKFAWCQFLPSCFLFPLIFL